MIEIEHVSYSYPNAPRPVFDDLSVTIAAGEFLLVCGESGAGKSTFLRLLNGLVPHFYGGRIAGVVRAWGRSTLDHQPRDMADLVGFVFQDPEAQFVVEIVEDEIVFGMENLGLPPRLMRRRVEEVLDQLGIWHLRRRQVASLSGGERQRVAIAAVLAAQPRALVLDEPTSQLDPHAAEEVLTALQKLNADLGLTVVLSEHRLERVVQYADRVLYFPRSDKDARIQGDKQSEQADRLLTSLSACLPILGSPRDVLAQIDLVPPLVALGKALGWSPLPLTIKDGRRFATGDRPMTQESATPRASRLAPHDAPNRKSIELSHVHFSYGEQEAVYDLSLAALRGEVLALMGRNGSGKTTLLKLIVGLLKPQRGAVSVLGHDITRMAVEDVAAFVGYVPQDPRTLLFHDTLWEELAFTLDNRRTTNDVGARYIVPPRTTVIERTLEIVGLAHLAQAYPRDLSGGEAQRAALAAILVGGPPVLLLDEPTRGLDYRAKVVLGHLLRDLAAEGSTIIMSTHDVELAASCADRVALLGDGELVVEGPVREVLSDSLIFSSQVAKLFPGTGWLTVADVLAGALK
jgi:energy-coupling factor transport system ATP-binding protein